MKYAILLLSVLLASCSAQNLMRRAISKDPTILTQGVVVERVTDTIQVFIPEYIVDTTVVIPEHKETFVAPLEKILSTGVTFENERSVVSVTFDANTGNVTAEVTAKEFHYPTRIKFAGLWFDVTHTYDKTVIKPEVKPKTSAWEGFLCMAGIIGAIFLLAHLLRYIENRNE